MSDRLEFFEEMKHIVPTNEKGHQKAMGDYRKFPNGASDKEYEKRVLLKASEQLMTLGSGNHFLSIVVNSGDEVGIVLHTGSRKPGWCVGNYWMRFAKKNGVSKNGLWMLPLDSDAGKGYYTDMLWAYDWAHLNRELIMRGVVNLLGLNWKEESLNMINETHNTATILEDNLVLHRKGATPAEDEVYGIIPGNMRDGVFVVKGLGNKEYLSTCSHGAGRKLGRKKAKEKLNWKDLKNEMEAMNIIVDIREDNVDESPNAYKDLWEVVKAQEDLVIEVVDHFSPVIVHIG
jgi:tRNA-splicing ligase RtcB